MAAGAAAAAILCGSSIMDYPETSGNLRKPAAEVSGRFPDFEKKYANKKFGNLPETYRKPAEKPPWPVSGGFQRFPDNPSLTDHTVHILRNVAVAIMTKTAAVRGQCCRAATTAAVKMDP